jgi:hypothetical protein
MQRYNYERNKYNINNYLILELFNKIDEENKNYTMSNLKMEIINFKLINNIKKEKDIIKNKYEYIKFNDLQTFYKNYCKKCDIEHNKLIKTINGKYINKLILPNNFKYLRCINCKILLNQINDIEFDNFQNIKNKKYEACDSCKIIYNNKCEICEKLLVNNNDFDELKLYNNKYYHLDCYNDNINCNICGLLSDNFKMHNLCYEFYCMTIDKCKICKKKIINNKNFEYINNDQLNEIIIKHKNEYIKINNQNVHFKCLNFKYLLNKCFICNEKLEYNNKKFNFNDTLNCTDEINKIIIKDEDNTWIHLHCIKFESILNNMKYSQYNFGKYEITKEIFNRIKLFKFNIDEINEIFNIICFVCNKKQFRINFNKYNYENYLLYLKNIKIFENNEYSIFNYFNVKTKYSFLCCQCNNKIINHNFYNQFFFSNIDNTNILSDKQINILNQIKNYCLN